MIYPPPSSRTDGAYPWVVVSILMLFSLLAFIDRQILNLLVGPIRADLGISDTQISFLLGLSFALFYTLCSFPLGRLADSHSRRGLIAGGVLLWSLATAAFGVARHYGHLLLARIGVGMGEAVLGPSAYSLIADSFPRERLGRAMSVYSMGVYLGSGLAFILGGSIILFSYRKDSWLLPLLGAVRPWQLVFLILGAVGIVMCLLLLLIREPARNAAYQPASLPALRAAFRERRGVLLRHNLGFAFLSMSAYSSSAWLPSYFVRVHQWEAGQFGLVYGMIILLFCTAGALGGGWWSDRLQRRGTPEAPMLIGTIAAGLSLPLGLLFVFPENGTLAAWLIVPAAVLAGMPTGVAAAALQQLAPDNMRGQATALFLFFTNLIGLGCGPTAVALCTDYLFRSDQAVGWSMLLVCGSAQLIGFVLLLSAIRPYRGLLTQQAAPS